MEGGGWSPVLRSGSERTGPPSVVGNGFRDLLGRTRHFGQRGCGLHVSCGNWEKSLQMLRSYALRAGSSLAGS
jgi:hypothetical protein